MITTGYVAPPTLLTTGNLLSGLDYVGQTRIRTAPNPPPNFSTFRSFGSGYRRPFGLYGGGGRGYRYSRQYWPYYPYYWPYYYPYRNYGSYSYGGAPSYTYPQEAPEQPPPPSELYKEPLSPEDKKRYCENLYTPYCTTSPGSRYCNRYSDLCD